ncbi:hypothetical protein ISG29_11855 [Nocardioides sp. CBS4Y-1]|uniref:ARB-07466-like C-terminal domain-containing protein n=1 Tax=Nocardioides acrostichi TaxID=2784339 RepID=A0A930UYE1_9ACTN|nr:hypothetical protein [Nocardioides acrostichi]
MAVGLVSVVGWQVVHRLGPVLGLASEGCTATVDGREVDLDLEQAENAALITAVSVRRGLPARAASIALATAYQESKLRNLTSGDRDSVGLFQQRPSQGWGTRAQVQDPVYATNAFYDALVKIADYRDLPITEAAQEVQRSGFPDAYADHEDDARVLASALTGNSPAAFSCEVDARVEQTNAALDQNGLTKRAEKVRTELLAVFGDVPLGGFAPGGVTSGHMPGSAHYEGRAVDAFVRPISPANKTRGWAIASYFVAQADRLRIATVIFDGKIWTATRSAEGWRDYTVPAGSSGDRAVLEHRDHVHIDVFA